MSEASRFGSVGWIDFTVPSAEELRDFYSTVIGRKLTVAGEDGRYAFIRDLAGAVCALLGLSLHEDRENEFSRWKNSKSPSRDSKFHVIETLS